MVDNIILVLLLVVGYIAITSYQNVYLGLG